jgi:hypothetical protein
VKEIQLTKGKVVFVDDEDFDWLMERKWRAIKSGRRYYAAGSYGVYMHREIMKTPAELVVDHLDGNSLNNQRSNLLNCKQSLNIQRGLWYDKYRGVYKVKESRKFMAQIGPSDKSIILGYYNTEVEAAKAYNEAALKYYGSFAKFNIIPEERRDLEVAEVGA